MALQWYDERADNRPGSRRLPKCGNEPRARAAATSTSRQLRSRSISTQRRRWATATTSSTSLMGSANADTSDRANSPRWRLCLLQRSFTFHIMRSAMPPFQQSQLRSRQPQGQRQIAGTAYIVAGEPLSFVIGFAARHRALGRFGMTAQINRGVGGRTDYAARNAFLNCVRDRN
jgi:hypothetical protein